MTLASRQTEPRVAPAPPAGHTGLPVRHILRLVLLPVAVTAVLAAAVSLGVELVHVQTEPWLEPAERWASLPARLHVLGTLAVWPFVALLLAVTGSLWATTVLTLAAGALIAVRSEEHTSELQSRENLVCRLLLEK